ncbi:MAG: FecR domain-containing protein [Candidatus Omnitrophica bacterium]|nr:FecR domain-containing protein [Candidatus Omnitrophota bacterium]
MKKIFNFMAVILSFTLAFPPALLADTVGKVTYIEGRVDKKLTDGDYFPAAIGETVSVGESLRTKSSSKAVVTFNDNSVVHVGESSQIKVNDYRLKDNGERLMSAIGLDRGNMRAVVSKTLDSAPFDVITPNAAGTVKGSDIFVSFQQSATNVLVSEGTFHMLNPEFPTSRINVEEGMTTMVPYNAPPATPRAYQQEEFDKFQKVTSAVYNVTEANSLFTKAMVSRIAGAVRVKPAGSEKWHTPENNEALKPGDTIETGKNGSILLSFDNGLTMELKPDTQIIIVTLSKDPLSGNYRNEFEAKYGSIISKLQNKPEGSVFTVKTPHAACGIRGTIMYLNVLPTMTRSFFEGGSGFVRNLIDGTEKVVDQGLTTTVGLDGKLEMNPTTDEDRSGLGSEFGNEGDGVYGYSEGDPDGEGIPGGEAGPADNTGGQGDPAGLPDTGGNDASEGENNVGDIGIFIPFTPELPVEEEEAPVVQVTGEVEAKMGYRGSFGVDEASAFEGAVQTTATVAPWEGTASTGTGGTYSPVTFDGTFTNPNGRDLMFGDISGTGDDTGAFKGWAVGASHGESNIANMISAIYIDPSGVAGTMIGYLEGTMDNELGTFSAIGDMFFVPTVYTDITPAGLNAALEPITTIDTFLGFDTNDDGTALWLDGTENGTNITGESWGIWEGIYGGEYDRLDNATEWVGFSGDQRGDGGSTETLSALVSDGGDGDVNTENETYSLTTIEGQDNLEGYLKLDVMTTYIDHFNLGGSLGTIVGKYSEEEGYYSYEGVGAGTWSEEALKFVSPLEGSIQRGYTQTDGRYWGISGYEYYQYSYRGDDSYAQRYWYRSDPYHYEYDNYYGNASTDGYSYYYGSRYGTWDTEMSLEEISKSPYEGFAPYGYSVEYENSYVNWDYSGNLNGLLGGTGSMWGDGAMAYLLMEYSCGDNSYGHVWGSDLFSYNYNDDTYTTYDGGAYVGRILGTEAGALEGYFIGLYIDPSGNGGYLKGHLSGKTYPETGFATAGGTITPTQMVASGDLGVDPEDLYLSAQTGQGGAAISGSFGEGTGSITGDENLETMNIVNFNAGVSQDWGIYYQRMAGTYNNPDNEGSFSAVIGGGTDPFGTIDPYLYVEKGYEYRDENGDSTGYYQVSYYTDNHSASVNYYRDNGDYYDGGDSESYYITYYKDGHYEGYDYNAGRELVGTWDTTKTLEEIVSTPPDADNAVLTDESKRGEGDMNYGYWIADINNGSYANGEYSGKLDGEILTYLWHGTMSGDVFGIYDTEGSSWMGVGTGVWQAREDLTFAGRWGSDNDSVYYNDNGELRWVTHEYGIIGAAVSPWDSTESYRAMGELSGDNKISTDPYIFLSPILSYNANLGNNTTPDGGAFYGWSAGLVDGLALEGKTLLVYIDPSGKAGILKGDMSGTVLDEINMWKADGTLTPEVMDAENTVAPENLYHYGNNDAGYLDGGFETGGCITGQDNFQEFSLVNTKTGVSADWGIYSQTLWGNFSNPNGDTAFSAVMGGYDSIGVASAYEHFEASGYFASSEGYNSGSFNYNYDSNNNSGYQYVYTYSDLGYREYYLSYDGDGTYSGYDYSNGNYLSGNWDTSRSLADVIAENIEVEGAITVYTSNSSYESLQGDRGYWIAPIDGTNVEGALNATLDGYFLGYTRLSHMVGDIWGQAFDSTGLWQGVGLGVWVGDQLKLSGTWGANERRGQDISSLYRYNSDYGYMEQVGEDSGLIGTILSPWTASTEITAMGEYYFNDEEPVESIWHTPVSSYNVLADDDSTLDGGAFYGTTVGSWKGTRLNGYLSAIYISPDHKAGVLSSYLEGEAYPGLEMWKMTGMTDAREKAEYTDIPASDISEYIYNTEQGEGSLFGHIGEEGSIEGSDNFYTSSLINWDEGKTYDWGIYDQKIWGYIYQQGENSGFSAVLGGNDPIGAYLTTTEHDGQYYYYDWNGGYYGYDGDYFYSYSLDNTQGYARYYRQNGSEYYQLSYKADGTWEKYFQNEEGSYETITGTWTPGVDSLEDILGTPPAPGTETAQSQWMGGNMGYDYSQDHGYWIMETEDGILSNGDLSFTAAGKFLTGTKMGDISGVGIGNCFNYEGSTVFQAGGAGSWEGERLWFSGVWGENECSIYSNDAGYYRWEGEDTGLIGGTSSPWNAPATIRAMGDFYVEGDENGAYLWHTPVESYNVVDDEYVTFDGGAFKGVSAGVLMDGKMTGGFLALYADPNGKIGYLRNYNGSLLSGSFLSDIAQMRANGGLLAGEYYTELGMWILEGTIAATVMEEDSGIDPADLSGMIQEENIDPMTFVGSFGSGNDSYIRANLSEGYSYSIDGRKWGAFEMKFGDSNYYENRPAGETTWQAVSGDAIDNYYQIRWLNGGWEYNGPEADNLIFGKLTGKGLSMTDLTTIEGDLFGENTSDPTVESGTFIASVLGVYEDEHLSFASSVETELSNEGYACGGIRGIFGGTESLWGGATTPALFIGEYELGEVDPNSIFVWGTGLTSENYDEESYTTYDGGAYYGLMGGYVMGGTAASLMRAFFVTPPDQGTGESKVGYIGGKFLGTTYQSIDMLELNGAVDIYREMPYAGSIMPEDLYDMVETDWIHGYGYNDNMAGEFTEGGPVLSLSGANWGIWGANIEGEYQGDLSAWKMPMTGEIGDYVTYLATLSGDSWAVKGHMDGKFTGLWVSPEGFGSIKGDAVLATKGEYIEAEDGAEISAQFGGAVAGEWVEAEELLDLANIVTEMQDIINNFNDVMIPITEAMQATSVYGQIQTATMDMNLYSFDATNIWAAIINGTYDQGVTDTSTWGAAFQSENYNVNLTGLQWADNQWSAGVTGQFQGNEIQGTAAGTYGEGQFQGAGAGTTVEQPV